MKGKGGMGDVERPGKAAFALSLCCVERVAKRTSKQRVWGLRRGRNTEKKERKERKNTRPTGEKKHQNQKITSKGMMMVKGGKKK